MGDSEEYFCGVKSLASNNMGKGWRKNCDCGRKRATQDLRLAVPWQAVEYQQLLYKAEPMTFINSNEWDIMTSKMGGATISWMQLTDVNRSLWFVVKCNTIWLIQTKSEINCKSTHFCAMMTSSSHLYMSNIITHELSSSWIRHILQHNNAKNYLMTLI